MLALLGALLMAFAVAMAVPLAVAWLGDEPHAARDAFAASIPAALLLGMLLWSGNRERPRELQPRDGVLLVVLTWTVLPLCASLPLQLYFAGVGQPLSFTDAAFEAMSALTTTGSTVLTGLDRLPLSINLWRCLLQWIGGMGILVLAVAILPLLGVGGSQLFRMESAGPMKDAKHTPRIAETAKGLWTVYASLSIACLLAYRAGGMGWADAWMHMFTTVSLGGLSSHDASFGFFASPALEWIAVVFMLVCSCNFALYFLMLRKRSWRPLLADPESRGTLGVMVGASLFVAALLMVEDEFQHVGEALRMAFFHVVSIASTTGYASTDYGQWPPLVPILLLLLSGLSTSAGSTGAGIKMIRLLILLKQARREMQRMLHPRTVNPVMLGQRPVAPAAIFSVLAFMLLYGATVIGLTFVLLGTGLPFDTALSAVIGSVNNMGPGLNEIGPAGNYQPFTDVQTWVCTLAMLLGRLELLSVFVLLTPAFWRD
ncbi:potassium uptake protein TrkH [Piscinibacter sakaiensis]|uniref:Trk system potassium uptake protein n=1 Tax=Piscinibacter sakaiensis TaxID=1547922 RepID=A0A0K8NZM5_PISS1|nr:potassium uptake protein TrkH [Piscinibacter sakaiensis]